MILTKKKSGYTKIFNGPSVLLIHLFFKLQASLMIISFSKDKMLFQLHKRESGRFYEDISRDNECVSKHRKEARCIRSCYDHGPAFNLCKKIKKEKEVILLKRYLCIEIQTNLKQVCIFCIT